MKKKSKAPFQQWNAKYKQKIPIFSPLISLISYITPVNSDLSLLNLSAQNLQCSPGSTHLNLEGCSLAELLTEHPAWSASYNVLPVIQLSNVFPHVGASNAGVTLDVHVVSQSKKTLFWHKGRINQLSSHEICYMWRALKLHGRSVFFSEDIRSIKILFIF